ncbi:MAG: site-2 protease family protein [Pyrinomonadaceae bacterium]
MKSWSLRVGRFFGIDVFIHWTFWILIAWIFLMHLGTEGGVAQGVRGALLILSLFVCVVLHEFGHALTARRFGVVTRDITLYPIGGISSFESLPEEPIHELLISIAGPLVNVVIATVLWIYLSSAGLIPDQSAIEGQSAVQLPFLFSLFVANVMLAVFNLIPAFPMDGGRVLRALMSLFTNRAQATRIAAGIGQVLAITFVFLGFFYNFWLVFIGLFIFLGAGGEAAFERTKAHLEGLKVSDALMRRVTVLDPESTLGDASEALINSQESVFVVADGGRPIGLLTVNDIIRGLAKEGRSAGVGSYMSPEFSIVQLDTKLPEFFQQVVTDGHSVAVVMDGTTFAGLIDRENIEEKVMIQQALASRA